MIYSILHGIGGHDIGIVGTDISRNAIGEEADADVPFGEEMATVFAFPNPSYPHPVLPVPLLKV